MRQCSNTLVGAIFSWTFALLLFRHSPVISVANAFSLGSASSHVWRRRGVRLRLSLDSAGDESGPDPVVVHLDITRLYQLRTEDVGEVLDLLAIAMRDQVICGDEGVEAFPVDSFLPPQVEKYRRFTSTYSSDAGQDGRFALFGSPEGASLHPDVVFSLDDPLTYVRDALSCGGDSRYPPSNEAVVVIPGPTTASSVDVVSYCSKVLDGIPLAQLHTSTDIRRGNIVLQEPLVTLLLKHNLIDVDKLGVTSGSVQKEDVIGNSIHPNLILHANCCDIVRIAELARADGSLSLPDSPSLGLRQTICKLLDAAVEASQRQVDLEPSSSDVKHLVLMAYSSANVDVSEALQYWKNEKTQIMAEETVESILFQAVTVVSIGSLSRKFPHGPAYLHVSMMDDPLMSTLGTFLQKSGGGENGAVYLQSLSPYNNMPSTLVCHNGHTTALTLEAHNLCACLIQLLAILMRVNGTRVFRGLFDLASKTIESDISTDHFAVTSQNTFMDVPPNLEDELLPAMIRATGGLSWLWTTTPTMALGHDDDDASDHLSIPSEADAYAILEWQYGYDAYQEIVASCSMKI